MGRKWRVASDESQVASGESQVASGKWLEGAFFATRYSPLATRHPRGFTLIELLVVLSILALLLSLAVPRYFQHVERAKEAVLRENLATLRDAVDQYHADTEQWPESLDQLVERRYLRAVPKDPITDSPDTWVLVPPEDGSGVYDVKSGAEGNGADGQAYGEW